jgi:hypothetical protein
VAFSIAVTSHLLENAPGAARTRNLQLRRLTLYPVELRALVKRDYNWPKADHNKSSVLRGSRTRGRARLTKRYQSEISPQSGLILFHDEHDQEQDF